MTAASNSKAAFGLTLDAIAKALNGRIVEKGCGVSSGFKFVKAEMKTLAGEQVQLIKEIVLEEVSLCPTGAIAQAYAELRDDTGETLAALAGFNTLEWNDAALDVSKALRAVQRSLKLQQAA